ncbi:MAG: hypothetical protein N2560_01245 [Ignavibacteria bacterium]|nr:hypothetical protein [Ignavibacteria bacterium]
MQIKRQYNIVSFISGKGSVGKSIILSLIAQILSEKFSTILIWDNDLYSPVQHILCGVEPNIKLIDIITQNISADKALTKVTNKIFLIGGTNNFEIDIDLSDTVFLKFQSLIMENDFDVILVDNHSGYSKLISKFAKNSKLNIMFLTDEPTAILDAYGLAKILFKFFGIVNIGTVVNNVIDKEDGINVSKIFDQATSNFLNIKFENYGIIPYEKELKKYFFDLKDFIKKVKDGEFVQSLIDISEKIVLKVIE